MRTIFGSDLHAGLSGIDLTEEVFELGEGIFLRRAYAHQFAAFMLAFAKPAPGKPHPGPWKATRGGFAFDVNAELYIPEALERKYEARGGLAYSLLFLLRLGVNPAITLPVFANVPFSEMAGLPDSDVLLCPYEIERRHFPLGIVGGQVNAESAQWVRKMWPIAIRLLDDHAEFELAAGAIDRGQFVRESSLALVSLWAAIEALFSPSTSELSFRVSALVASYLEPPGQRRFERQKSIAKLYTKRSAAAHGKPSHDPQNIVDSFNLLREILIKMLDAGEVPSKAQLEALLFGGMA